MAKTLCFKKRVAMRNGEVFIIVNLSYRQLFFKNLLPEQPKTVHVAKMWRSKKNKSSLCNFHEISDCQRAQGEPQIL